VLTRFSLLLLPLQSLVGFDHTIPHLDGHVVPISSRSVTQHGDVQRIAKEGMPHHGSSTSKGEMYVKYEVVFPKELTKAQKEGLEKILPK
jgi:DnaJ-class molecular chaperone